jgi:hypothetical protein
LGVLARVVIPATLVTLGALAGSARAQDALFGYQLGLTQSLGTAVTTDDSNFDLPDAQLDNAVRVNRLTGYQSTTTLASNVTLDIVTPRANNAFLAGLELTQLVPFGVPEEGNFDLQDPTTTLIGTFQYIGQYIKPTWALAWGGDYTYAPIGRLANASAANQVAAGGPAAGGARAGLWLVNEEAHTVSARTNLQLTHTNWDFNLQPQYTYATGATFNQAALPVDLGGAGAGIGQIGANATGGATNCPIGMSATPAECGTFAIANVHQIGADAGFRVRMQRRHSLEANANAAWLIPIRVNPAVDPNTTANDVPQTLINTLNLQYTYNPFDETQYGIQGTATYSLRAPETNNPQVDASGVPVDLALTGDTFIYRAVAVYLDRIRRLNLQVQLELGIAQPTLFQPPLGALPAVNVPGTMRLAEASDFVSVRASIQPVAALTLNRRFDPVDVTLTVNRDVNVGALGAGALITLAAGMNFGYVLDLGNFRALSIDAGFNFADLQAVDANLFQGIGNAEALAAGFSSRTAGANLAMGMPLFEAGGLVTDIALAYNFVWVDIDPSGFFAALDPTANVEPTATHAAVLTLRAQWGRGTLQAAGAPAGSAASAGGGGGAGGTDPRTGAPLASSRLADPNARMLDGVSDRGPGRPAAPTSQRDRFKQSGRQKDIDKKAAARGQIVKTSKTIQQLEEEAQEAEAKKKEEARDKRSREFGWEEPPAETPAEGETPPEPAPEAPKPR